MTTLTPTRTEPAVTTPKSARRRRGGLWLHVLLIGGLLVVITPFVWMVLGSIKTTAELRQSPPTWLPRDPTLGNYVDLFERLDFARYFFNTTLVAGAVTLGNLLFSSMLGYALAKLDFPGKRVLFVLMLGTLMVPAIVTFMPLFVLISNMGMVNTYPGLILPTLAGASGVAFGGFLMRQYIQGLPDELIDAARVDGAGEYRIFFNVILPLCGPALAALAILTFLAAWNNFLWPLVVATTEDMYTLPVAIALFAVGQHETNHGLLLAGAVTVVLPVVLVFIVLQRYFTQGIAMTGIK
ncbi:MAG TPA: carbohydrate ABC transporter permease [Jiangellaceae bacterium]